MASKRTPEENAPHNLNVWPGRSNRSTKTPACGHLNDKLSDCHLPSISSKLETNCMICVFPKRILDAYIRRKARGCVCPKHSRPCLGLLARCCVKHPASSGRPEQGRAGPAKENPQQLFFVFKNRD